MAKFSGPSIKAGEQYNVPSPVQDLQERVPQAQPAAESAGDPLLDQIIAEQSGPAVEPTPVAPIDQASVEEEYARQEQIERERVPTIKERVDPSFQPEERYNPVEVAPKKSPEPKVDGGLNQRANRMAMDFQKSALRLPTKEGKSVIADTLLGLKAVEGNNVSPQFARLASLVAENTLADIAQGDVAFDPTVPKSRLEQATEAAFDPDADIDFNKTAFSRDEGNAQLGKELAREWQRYTAGQQNQPTHEWSDIPQDQARILGDAVKTIWAEQNPDLVKRVPAADGRIYYQLTPKGVEDLTAGTQERKRIFPKKDIKPSKVKPEKGKLIGEQGKLARKSSGELGRQKGQRIIDEAKENLSQVPNVVDVQRHKIALATILPAFGAQQGLAPEVASVFADIHSIGPDKMQDFAAAYELDPDNADPPDVAMQKYKKNVAQGVRAAAQERKGANFLTYYTQAFNGRIAPQQGAFDPTTSKYVRFLTRNAVPAMVKFGGRLQKNIEQMYAMMLVDKADVLLPEGRVRALNAKAPTLIEWGNRLQTLVDGISDAQVEAVAEAIANGVAVNNPEFPQLPPLALDPVQDADLLAAIASKGEDGPHFIDGLIDFAKYAKWKKDPIASQKPFPTYFNAYMDGKTNGIASNGLQMGDRNIALATGVIRTQDQTLLDDGDVRDQLQDDLLQSLDMNGWHGLQDKNLYDPMDYVARKLYSTRNLNKATTMTFGYGKELKNFSFDIAEFAAMHRQGDPKFAESWRLLSNELTEEGLIDSLLNQYVVSLGNVLSQDSFESRVLMQNAAATMAMIDQPLSIRSYTGFELVYGGYEFDMNSDPETLTYSRYTAIPSLDMTVSPEFTGDFKTKRIAESQGADAWRNEGVNQEYSTRTDAEIIEQTLINNKQVQPPTSFDHDYIDLQNGEKVDIKTVSYRGDYGITDKKFQEYKNKLERGALDVDSFEMWERQWDTKQPLQAGQQVRAINYGRIPAGVWINAMEKYPADHPATRAGYTWHIPKEKLHQLIAESNSKRLEARKPETLVDRQKKITAAANDTQRGVGGKARGGAIPGPIQSLDAATVAMTASGKSWDKLKMASNGNPYMHTIYDAFKVDAMGYDVVLDEVNKNWLKAGLDWSYLDETYKSVKDKIGEYSKNFSKLTPQEKHTPQSAMPGGPFAMIGSLYFKKPNMEGKLTQGALWNSMFKMHPVMRQDVSEEIQMEMISESVKKINKAMEKAGAYFIVADGKTPELTPHQANEFLKVWLEETGLSRRLINLRDKTNKKKKELRKEIESSPNAVYQYYAH